MPNCINKKVIYGQYFTKDNVWLKKHIENFIKKSNANVAYDPFAGNGDILNAVNNKYGITKIIGLDIDRKLGWKFNDSLKNIPKVKNSIIITNPPYLSKNSATHKKLNANVHKYFAQSDYDDLYLISLENMICASENIVAIVPETFINSNFKNKNLLHSITILEENPFEDTENPVVVACFDGKEKSLDEVKIYKNDKFINNLDALNNMRLVPQKHINCVFNDKKGWLGVRCIDTTNPNELIKFDYKNNIDYDFENNIKNTSRSFTLIGVDVKKDKRNIFINKCNDILKEMRVMTSDVILSPFKGNMKNGKRRRRLDFYTCRAIVEMAYDTVCR